MVRLATKRTKYTENITLKCTNGQADTFIPHESVDLGSLNIFLCEILGILDAKYLLPSGILKILELVFFFLLWDPGDTGSSILVLSWDPGDLGS